MAPLVGRSDAIASSAETAEQMHLKFEMVVSVSNGHITLNAVREQIAFKLNL